MPTKKTILISAIVVILLSAGAFAVSNGVTPEQARKLDFSQKVKISEVVPCDKHPVFSQVPACQKNKGPPVRSPGKGPNKNKGQETNIIKQNNQTGIYRVRA